MQSLIRSGIITSKCSIFYWTFSLLFFLSLNISAQTVEAAADTNSILIGEQIRYSISVESDSSKVVVFPEGQVFSPLEMVESFQADTSRLGDRLRLIKSYTLTHWDSGSYAIPRQRVDINGAAFFTDSIPVEVRTVVVDTTKQKMYPIKPAVEIPEGFPFLDFLWWLLGILLIAALGYFIFYRRKKQAEAAKRLPPYEQAMEDLHRLDDSHLLEDREVKEYYSQLSAAVRRYLDGEVYDHAMESTTGELIAYLKREKEQGRLLLSEETIDRLRVILNRADLVKFANSSPDIFTAREDRSGVEHVIQDTRDSIPQPSEEDLIRDQQYQAKVARKKKLRKIAAVIIGVVIVISGGTAYFLTTQGPAYLEDLLLGNQSKEMLEKDWISSEYGTPPVEIATPVVLKRVLSDSVSNEEEKVSFRAGSLYENLYVDLSIQPTDQNFDIEEAVERVYTYMENKGARNILTKQEEISTLNGAKGIRIYGTMTLEDNNSGRTQKKKYEIMNFAERGGFQQIVIIFNEGDEYAEEISQRIMNSVELRKAGNDV